jgi:hypothetical protein
MPRADAVLYSGSVIASAAGDIARSSVCHSSQRPLPCTPIHDVDVLLLMSTALATKRRPAELVEIMAAMHLLHGSIPLDVDVAAAFQRLSTECLLAEEAGRYTLTPEGLALMGGVRNTAHRRNPRSACSRSARSLPATGRRPKGQPIPLATEAVGARDPGAAYSCASW